MYHRNLALILRFRFLLGNGPLRDFSEECSVTGNFLFNPFFGFTL